MIIQSRKESDKRLGPYKEHVNTVAIFVDQPPGHGLQLASAYIPTVHCPADAQPWYCLAFGMDGRRVLLTLDHKEAQLLRDQLDEQLKSIVPRRIK